MALSKRSVILLDVAAVLALASMTLIGVDYSRSGGRVVLAAPAPAPQAASTPAAAVNAAADAMGGKPKLLAAKTLTMEGTGNTWTAGGIGTAPDAEEERTRITAYKRDFDLSNGRMHFTQTGVFQYPFALGLGNAADQRLDGDVAFGAAGGRGGAGGGAGAGAGAGGAGAPAGNGAAAGVVAGGQIGGAPQGANAAAPAGGRGPGAGAAPGGPGGAPAGFARANAAAWHQRRMDYLSNPLTAMRAALDPAAKLSAHSPANVAGVAAVDVTTPQGETFTLGIDSRTHLPSWISWKAADANLGDVTQQAVFEDYADVNGIKLPARIETMTDRWTTGDFNLKNTLDADVGNLAAPDALKNSPAPQPPAPQPVMVTADPIAKGIWYMGGAGEHSVLFEFADHLVLFETPGGDPRTLAVIQKARETVPGKPLTIAINSHQHFDHAGGFRAAVSEGLTMYSYKDNVEHFREIATRPHTMQPDALQMKPQMVKNLKLVAVDDTMEMKDSAMDIILYHIHPDGITHAATELMVWVPQDRILVEADQFDAGWTRHLWGENFIWNVEQFRKLDVDKILPVHGDGAEDWSFVVKTIRSKPTYYRNDDLN